MNSGDFITVDRKFKISEKSGHKSVWKMVRFVTYIE